MEDYKIPFTNNPATNDIDKIRLEVGDVYSDMEWLSDDTYDYLLDKHDNNIKRAALDAATYILFQLTRYTRERAGDIEVYGDAFFKNYRSALLEYLRNPALSPFLPIPYAGGISRVDITANNSDTDHIPLDIENPSNICPTTSYEF